jgi:hypothetical protein
MAKLIMVCGCAVNRDYVTVVVPVTEEEKAYANGSRSRIFFTQGDANFLLTPLSPSDVARRLS